MKNFHYVLPFKLRKPIYTGLVLCYLIGSSSSANASCRPDILRTAPTERYIIHENGTVTDTKTKLMWQRCSVGQSGENCELNEATRLNWSQALQSADSSVDSGDFAGYSDWRLPNINELSSIVEYACHTPAINTDVFPRTPPNNTDFYWSSTPVKKKPAESHALYMKQGFISRNSRESEIFVRLVRSVSDLQL